MKVVLWKVSNFYHNNKNRLENILQISLVLIQTLSFWCVQFLMRTPIHWFTLVLTFEKPIIGVCFVFSSIVCFLIYGVFFVFLCFFGSNIFHFSYSQQFDCSLQHFRNWADHWRVHRDSWLVDMWNWKRRISVAAVQHHQPVSKPAWGCKACLVVMVGHAVIFYH